MRKFLISPHKSRFRIGLAGRGSDRSGQCLLAPKRATNRRVRLPAAGAGGERARGASWPQAVVAVHGETALPLECEGPVRLGPGLGPGLRSERSRGERPPGARRRSRLPAVYVMLVTVVQLVGELVHYVPEYHRVQVFPQNVKQIPVSHLASPNYGVDVVPPDQPEAQPHGVDPRPRRAYDDHPVHQRERRQEAEDHEPEPEEHVDLLVDDVQRQDAECIVALHLAGRAELVEQRALDHPMKRDAGVSPTKYNDMSVLSCAPESDR
ncbi:hypothetical protein EVAR_17745_1 [Eumeta japonica]|uniref:Uncharacterized protein n=1 Tax=Eumeta variegata TaxID=151549 RepID=A0A4C1TTA8_EUMVA|nr:hypothetical protein EVAR_17745_1 [Eumeta japonica]